MTFRNVRAFGRARGFTMVELMIVIAIVITLIVIAVPNFAKMIDRSRLRGAADAIVSLMSSARTAAVQRNRDVAISFAGSSPAWCVGANAQADAGTQGNQLNAAIDCDCTTNTNCKVGDPNATSGQGQYLTLNSSNYSSVTLGSFSGFTASCTNSTKCFTYDGRLGTLNDLTAAPSVTLTSPAGTYKLTLNVAVLGQPSLCVPAGSPDISGYSAC